MAYLLAEAARLGVDCVHLTSNPSRIAANALYQKIGFERKETNCYIFDIKAAARNFE